MKKNILIIVVILFLLSIQAQGEEIASGRLNMENDHLVGEVCVKGQVVFTIHQDGSYDPLARAQEIADRINSLSGQPAGAIKVKAEYKEGNSEKAEKNLLGFAIYWGEIRLFTVSPFQAKLNNSTPEELAGKWADDLKSLLKKDPVFKVFPGELLLAPGESTEIKIISDSTAELTWKITSSSEILSVSKSDIPDRLTVKALSTGDSTVEVCKGEKFLLNVSVRDYAGVVFPADTVTVSGSPASEDLIKEAVLREISRCVRLNSGARLFLDPFNVNPHSLAPGKEMILTVPFKISGQGLIDVEKFLSVKVKNVQFKPEDPLMLLMSNSPEKITSGGVLFSENLSFVSPVRLMFYHINKSDSDKWLIVDLLNSSSSPAGVWIINGCGGPSPYEAFVGHVASSRFISNLKNFQGEYCTIPAGKRLSIYTQRVPPEQIVTGFSHIQFSTSSDVELIVRAENNLYEAPSGELLPPGNVSTQCRGVFSTPKVFINEFYQAGEPEKSIYIGKSPFLIDINSGEELYGNYGVLYDVTLQLKNNTAQLQDIDLFFTSQGGIAQGTFLIDGTLVETPVVRSSEHAPIATFLLEPGEERLINLQTIPQGGSHYPVRVVIKS